MSDEIAVRLGEFQALRQEINNRLTISYTLLALGLAAFGTGISVIGKTSQVLVALSAVSSLLWLYWTDNSLSIRRIAAYIAIELAPPADGGEWNGGLAWEVYLRQISAGGAVAHRALFKDAEGIRTQRIRRAQYSDAYTTVLFGGASPLVLVLYVRDERHAGGWVWIAAGLCALLWGYAVLQFAWFIRQRTCYDEAIAASPLAMRARAIH